MVAFVRHVCAILVLSLALAGSQEPSNNPMKGVVYRIPGMDRVAVTRDLRYGDVEADHLRMDVYRPEASVAVRRPAVLFVHGNVPRGAPAKNLATFQSWGRLAAASGMVGVTFTHRLGFPNPGLAEAGEDFLAAIRYIRANSGRHGIDPERICVAAFSGGGSLLSPVLAKPSPYVKCLVAFYAFLDIRESEIFTLHETAGATTSFSPIVHLDSARGIPPMFIARGGRDATPGLNPSIDRFLTEALSKNLPVTLINHPSGGHGFDTDDDTEGTQEIIRAALAFMKAHLGMLPA